MPKLSVPTDPSRRHGFLAVLCSNRGKQPERKHGSRILYQKHWFLGMGKLLMVEPLS